MKSTDLKVQIKKLKLTSEMQDSENEEIGIRKLV